MEPVKKNEPEVYSHWIFERAREHAATHLKGFPAWRVIPWRDQWAIELIPGTGKLWTGSYE